MKTGFNVVALQNSKWIRASKNRLRLHELTSGKFLSKPDF